MATGIQTSVQRGRRSGLVQHPKEKNVWEKGQSAWNSLGLLAQRLILACLLSLVLAGLFGSYLVTSNQFVALYAAKLNLEDVEAISTALSEANIEHTIAPTEDSIELHPDECLAARAKLSRLGLPRNQPLALSQDGNFPPSSEEQKRRSKQQLEYEIVETLRKMENITDARVKLAIPSKTYFQDDTKQTKASVFLKLKNASTLDRDAMKGVTSLVAHSVPELLLENVAIFDQQGHEFVSKEAPESLEQKIQWERETHLQQKLQNSLEKIYGENVHCAVNVALDFSQEERRVYTPGSPTDDGVVKDSIQLVHEMLEGKSELSSDKSYDQRKEAVNYKYSENYYAMLRDQAKIERITATVLVDGASADELVLLEGVVKGSIGVDESRGDAVYMNGSTWNRELLGVWGTEPMAVVPLSSTSQSGQDFFVLATVVAMSVLFTLGMSRLLMRRVGSHMDIESRASGPPALTRIVDQKHSKSGASVRHDPTTHGHSGRLEDLESLVGDRPERVATLLRSTWLS